MKRLLLATGVVALLLVTVLTVFFTASDFRVENQRYFLSYYDFLFLLDSHIREARGAEPKALTDGRYSGVMSHARRTAHREVEERVAFELAAWGDAVVPRLVRELEVPGRPGRVLAAARALGLLRASQAVPAFHRALERARAEDRWLLNHLIDAGADVGPEMAPVLINLYVSEQGSDLPKPFSLLDAIGKTGGGTEFLLAELAQAESDDEILALLWPLAFTEDERAARALIALLHHPALAVRRRARDAPGQSMGFAIVEPAIDFLESETDDVLRNWVLNSLLDSPATSRSERAIDFIAALVEDPVVGWRARESLARSKSTRGVEILLERADRYPPRWLLEHAEYMGGKALPLVEYCLAHEDPRVRIAAIDTLSKLASWETVPFFEIASTDPDGSVRGRALAALERTDIYLLEESFRRWLSDNVGRNVRRARPPDRRGVRVALDALSLAHWVGLAVSVLVGLLLLIGWVRAFEPFKLALVLQFLLVEGIVGDFFFFGDPVVYRWATAGRILLLLGLLFLRDDPLPGEARGRIERLVVRSLWLLVPLLLLIGTPLIADALRLALRDFGFMKWAILLTVITTVLILEQAFVPWHVFPRGGRVERGLTFLLSSSITLLLLVPLFRVASASVPSNQGLTSLLLAAPLAIAMIFHARQSRLLAHRRCLKIPADPPGRLQIVDDGDALLIKLRRVRRIRSLPLLLFGAVFLGLSWLLVFSLDAVQGGAPAMFLVMILSVLGTALGALVFSGLASGFTVQVREGAIRWAGTYLGGALGASPWYRKLRLPAFARDVRLTQAERRYIVGLLVVPLLFLTALETRADRDDGLEEALHPLDCVRILETGSEGSERWTEAIETLLGDDDELGYDTVSSVVRRVDVADVNLKQRAAAALSIAHHHPKALSKLREWALGSEEPLRATATKQLLSYRGIGSAHALRDLLASNPPERLEILRALVDTLLYWEVVRHDPGRNIMVDPVMKTSRGSAEEVFDRDFRWVSLSVLESTDSAEREAAREILAKLAEREPRDPREEARPVERTHAEWLVAGLAWLPGLAGAVLFVWGFHLAALALRVRYRPVAKAKSAALGPVALEGTVESKSGFVEHPVTGERCVYYVDPKKEHASNQFYLVDETGRVAVQPLGAVILSDDGVLVEGERVHVVGVATRDPEGNLTVRADQAEPPLYRRMLHGTMALLFGFGSQSAATRLLFSDFQRCFWIWDDLAERPLARQSDVLWLATGMSLAGAWMIVFTLAAAGVIDAGLTPLVSLR